jgi:hypothetical protein
MATFRCEKFPEGKIRTSAGIVPFSGGLAVVDDPEVAQALREVPEVFGVAEVTEPPAPEACPLCGARANVETTPATPAPEAVVPTPDSVGATGDGDSLPAFERAVDQAVEQLAEQSQTPLHLVAGDGDGQGDGDEGQDDGDTASVTPERPDDDATRGDWLVYLSAVLGKPQSEFKGKKLPELKALAPNQ